MTTSFIRPYYGLVGVLILLASQAWAQCPVDHATLQTTLQASVAASGGPSNGGLDNHMWATVVDADGEVCAVAFSGGDRLDQWGLSRVISAQKANTARGLSRESGSGGAEIALSTANLWAAVQPGGSLFGLQHSNPVDTSAAYGGNSMNYGQANDHMVGSKIGGVNVFGGGLALYDASGVLVGAIGASGDTSCADHNVAWRVRMALSLGTVPGGVGPNSTDGINYDLSADGVSAGGFGHPECGGTEKQVAISIGAGA